LDIVSVGEPSVEAIAAVGLFVRRPFLPNLLPACRWREEKQQREQQKAFRGYSESPILSSEMAHDLA
jgi:hypothetical protein